jgi:hypothetical protein
VEQFGRFSDQTVEQFGRFGDQTVEQRKEWNRIQCSQGLVKPAE